MSELFFIHSGLEIVHANPAFCTLVGADSQEQLIGTSPVTLVTSDYRSPIREQVDRIENTDTPALGLTVEFQTFTDHSQHAFLIHSVVEWDGSEQVQTSVFPITETDLGCDQLLFDHVIDEAPIGITVSDPFQPDNPLIYVNDGFCEMTGFPREEILGQNCRFLQGEATCEKPVAEMRNAIETEQSTTVELRNYRKDGSMFWNRVTIIPIRDDSGTVTNFLGYQQDITNEKHYERDLSLFKSQAEESKKSILITDPDGTIQYVNPAFERLNGYTASEALGRNPRMLKSGQHDEEFYAELWDTITAGKVWEEEIVNKTRSGELYRATLTIIPETDEDDEVTHFLGIAGNITEEVLTRQTLDVLTRVLRHDLRNALNVIDGHAELLEGEELDAETHRASVTAIRDQTASMQKIAERTAEIRSIWDPAESHKIEDQINIESLADTYQQQYSDADITCKVEQDGEITVRDTELFKKAIDEAVENAVCHNDQSPPEVTIEVQRDLQRDQLQIRVADNGPGIPEYEQQVIESGEETPLNHSLGIDLWFIEWITTALGGELIITDNEPRGSLIILQLPSGSLDIEGN